MKEHLVSLVVTFHNERILAHQTLMSIAAMRQQAHDQDIQTELICVCDNVDEETLRVVSDFPLRDASDRIVRVEAGNPGAARNVGIAEAKGRYCTILDGDDIYTGNWITSCVSQISQESDRVILHPEFVISFGDLHSFNWQIDQRGKYFDYSGLGFSNYWAQWLFAETELLRENPYPDFGEDSDVFGFEDWAFNCSTVEKGILHVLCWGTVGFYRRKVDGRLSADKHRQKIMPKISLFDDLERNERQQVSRRLELTGT